MTRLILASILAVFLLLPTAVSANGLNTQSVDALVQAYGGEDEPGISIAISKDGELIYEGWKGQADLERRVAINQDTKFHIASISKQFTAFAILTLAQEGKLTLDQPVSDFFPQMEAGQGKATIRHLLDHTGGLREVNSLSQMLGITDGSPVTAEQMLALILRQRGVNFAAGSDEEYSNTGYQLLAHIVAQTSGVSFAEYLQEKVFGPLGMEQTFVRTDPSALIKNVALSYDIAPQSFINYPVLSTTYGSTGMISTPRDLLVWGHSLTIAELAQDPVLQAMSLRSMLPDGRETVAGNGQEFREFRGIRTWSHGGTTGGYKSFLLRLPDQGIVIAVMGNRADFLKATFAFDVAAALLGEALEPAPEPDQTPETIAELDSYVGDYRLFPGTVFSIRRKGEALTFAGYGQEEAFALPRISKGAFMLSPARDIRLEFRDFTEGQTTQMRWQVSADGYLRARRVDMEPLSDSPLNLSLFTGTYYSDELQMGFDIVAKDDGLSIETRMQGPVPLIEYAPGVFRPQGPVPLARMEFVSNGAEPVESVLVGSPVVEGVEFKRLN